MGGVTTIRPMAKIARILLNTIGLVNLLPLIEKRANETQDLSIGFIGQKREYSVYEFAIWFQVNYL